MYTGAPGQALTVARGRPVGSGAGTGSVQDPSLLSAPAAGAHIDEVLHKLSALCDVGGAQCCRLRPNACNEQLVSGTVQGYVCSLQYPDKPAIQ